MDEEDCFVSNAVLLFTNGARLRMTSSALGSLVR